MASAPTPAAALKLAARRLRIEAARRDANAFVEFVGVDPETGQAMVPAPLHRAWQQLAGEHPRLILFASVDHGKTQQLSIFRPLWLLGRDTSMRIVLVSNAQAQVSKFVRSIARHIERNERLREVFPHLKPASPWNEDMITVQREGVANDPSVQGCPLHGAILGARSDLIVCDDLLDYESVRTEQQRQVTIDWVANALLGRLSPRRGRMILVGVAQHARDLMHELARRGAPWVAFRFGALDSEGKPRWPERWSAEALASKRKELGPLEGSRQLDCRATSDTSSYVQAAWIQPSLDAGNGLTTSDRYPGACVPHDPDIRIFHGVDIATSKRGDLAVVFTIAANPRGVRQVLNISVGRAGWVDLKNRMIDAHRRYGGVFVVESAGQQMIAVEELRQLRRVDVIPFATGRGEKSLKLQIDRLVSEMSRGQWVVPNKAGWCEPEVARWLEELIEFDPEKHTGDRLAASLFARWAASEASSKRVEYGTIDLMSR